jgi:hypothetical protein
MSYEIPGFTRSYEAAGDLSTQQFRFVKLSGATITAVTAATDAAVGVLQGKPDHSGMAGEVMISGVTRAIASKAIAAGVPVYITSDGRVTDTVASNKAVGIAEEAAAGAGSVLPVLLKPLGAL